MSIASLPTRGGRASVVESPEDVYGEVGIVVKVQSPTEEVGHPREDQVHPAWQEVHCPDGLDCSQPAQGRQIEKHHPGQRLGQTMYYLGGQHGRASLFRFSPLGHAPTRSADQPRPRRERCVPNPGTQTVLRILQAPAHAPRSSGKQRESPPAAGSLVLQTVSLRRSAGLCAVRCPLPPGLWGWRETCVRVLPHPVNRFAEVWRAACQYEGGVRY